MVARFKRRLFSGSGTSVRGTVWAAGEIGRVVNEGWAERRVRWETGRFARSNIGALVYGACLNVKILPRAYCVT